MADTHYDPRYEVSELVKGCSVPRCPRDHYALGLCNAHYGRQRQTGELGAPKIKPIPRRQHGTASMYGNYGCRCELCKQAMSEANRNKPTHVRVDPFELAKQILREHEADTAYLTDVLRRDGIAYANSATEHHNNPFTQFTVLDEFINSEMMMRTLDFDGWRRAKARANRARTLFL